MKAGSILIQESPKADFIYQNWQYDFVYAQAPYPAMISAWGTGKSMSLIFRALLYAQCIPNNLIYILRREWVDLKDSTIKDFELYTGMTVGSDRNVKLPNGSVIMFRHIEELNRAGKNLQNVNLGAFFIEQAEELPTDREFFILFGRLRRKVAPNEYFKALCLPDHTGCVVGNVAGDNWIKKLWKDKRDPQFPLFEAITQDNAANLPKDFLDGLELLKARKLDIYNRFVMNDWSAEVEGKVFQLIDNCIAGFNEEPRAGFDYLLGADFAKTHDFNVAFVLNRQTKHFDYFERWNNTSWNLTKERFKAIAARYNNALLIPDSTGVGDPIVEDLQHDGVRVFHTQKPNSEVSTPGIKFNNINKENMVEKLKVCIEQALITFPNHEVAIQELRDFECEILPSRNYRYQAPEGKFDDCVIAMALAVWGMYGGIYAPDYVEPKPETEAQTFWKQVEQDRARFNQAQDPGAQREIAAEEARQI